MLATKSNVLAFELLNEIGNAIMLFPEPMLASWAAQFSAAVRAAAPNLPITISDVSNGNSTIIGKFSDWQRIRRYAPYVDFHVYPAVANTLKPWHTAACELVSDRPVIFGEIGAYRPSRTGAQMADAYETIRQTMIRTPSVKGVIQWATVNNDFGLYDETTDTLQTDIASTWALFPST
ncbi:hypothetical protein HQ308_22180 [Rhodococcus sp. BP-241]|uniref:hypothetical protein n=1 Tax=Rhodococcus sp. BP-241 TaxID=2739441 RepID=UPI001C9AF2AC|nr:hypothetical protein [Rhodococcus sp. BP-241]MBY6709504.1 hypothetical protein [Rhodococcus sp. BP-241]